jgi:hypothetical protein
MSAERSRTEARIGILVLITLTAIATGVVFQQSRFDPGLFSASLPQQAWDSALPVDAASSDAASSGVELPQFAGLAPLTPAETFASDNLSDKINGKAELYLSSGFQSLLSRRLKSVDDPSSWMELFVYDMGNLRNAFAVFSLQRRADARDAGFARFAYQTDNALFFVHGREYVEVIAANEKMSDALLALGESYVQQTPLDTEDLSELGLFPAEHLDAASISLHASDVFGFDRLDNTFSALYEIDGHQVRAFLSLRSSAQEAEELASAFHQFFVENGGTDIQAGLDIPGAKLIEIFDFYELIFTHNGFLAGVHESEDVASARKVGLMLYRELQEGAK